MSLDFFLTHFYRLVVHDVVLLSDVYWFYSAGRTEGKTVKEFAEILSNMLEIESQNFEEINTAKLSIGEGESVLLIIWDYFHDVIIKHFLDDASQFPFWASKVIVTSQPQKFGMPIIRAYFRCLQDIYLTRGVRGLFEGCTPYMFASCYHNYKFLVKVTHTFIVNVFSKIPHPGTAPIDDEPATPLGSPVLKNTKKAITNGPHTTSSTTTATSTSTSTAAEAAPLPPTGGSVKGGFSRLKKSSLTDLYTLASSPVTVPSAADQIADLTTAALPANGAQLVHNLGPEQERSSKVSSASSSSASTSSTTSAAGLGGLPTSGTTGTAAVQAYQLGGPPAEGAAGSMRVQLGRYTPVSALRTKKAPVTPKNGSGSSLLMKMVEKGCVAFCTHPLMALAVAMVTDPLYYGQNSVLAFFRMTANRGIAALYSGFRSRLAVSLIPLSPLMMLGIADMVVYRRMEGQGTSDSTGGVVSVIKQITSEGSVLSLLNYGLLTAVHALPGFCSFVAMRSLSWLFLGSSLQRKHQIQRRQDIVNAHISLIDKKAPYE